MKVQPTDHVLHLSFDDEAYGRADVFCGMFNKRQVANKTYKPIEYSTTRLPFKDKTFDFVYVTNLLAYHHQPETMIEEIKRISHKAHIRERSEFAEMLFGWETTRWIVSVENMDLIIKSKNELKFGRFGPFFHGLYANDPTFFDYCSQNPGLMNISVDWYEEDDVIEEYEEEVEEFVVPSFSSDEKSAEGLFEEAKLEDTDTVNKNEVQMAEMRKVKKKLQKVKSIFRPCQVEYFDDVHITLGKIKEQIDVRQLKNKHLQ